MAMTEGLQQIRRAEDAIYEIQELRHASSSTHTSRINELFTALETKVGSIRALVSQPKASEPNDIPGEVNAGEGERAGPAEAVDAQLQEAWRSFEKRWNRLKDEMKEDGWLVRFRTTAEQAESMMESLEKSAEEMKGIVHRDEAPGQAQDIGAQDLARSFRGHLAMRSTYASSISRILKMMDRSLADRATKNGEALRRHGDMASRWSTLQRDLSQLEGRVRIALEQQASRADDLAAARKGGKGVADDVELLVESLRLEDDSLHANGLPGSISGYDTPGSRRTKVHTTVPGTSSVASSSLSSRASDANGLGHGLAPRATLSPGSRYPSLGSASHPSANGMPTLRRRVSQTSLVSTTTAATNSERPRWNASTKVNHSTSTEQTPGTAKRRLTMNGAPISGSQTPSRAGRSGATTPTFAAPATTPSRIPMPKPRQSATSRLSMGAPQTITPRRSIPGLAVSTTSNRITLSHPSNRSDDVPPVPPLPARTPSRQTTRTSLASDASGAPPAYLSRTAATTTPRNSRHSLARGPPSAYRTGPPTPGSGIPPVPRPSSRMSIGAASVAGSAYGFGGQHHDDLQPFVPSKYDLLDNAISQILADNAFEHFVARVDPSLKKGQRKGDNEEWKGTFVFGGPAEKGTPVKMMQLASRDGGKISKVLARRAGQWVPVVDILNERKEKNDEVF